MTSEFMYGSGALNAKYLLRVISYLNKFQSCLRNNKNLNGVKSSGSSNMTLAGGSLLFLLVAGVAAGGKRVPLYGLAFEHGLCNCTRLMALVLALAYVIDG